MATRIRQESGFKKTLSGLPIGSEIQIGSIQGDFTLPKQYENPLVFLAGGIGITPFISMLRFVSEEKLSYDITLVYSNRDKNSSAFLEELETLKTKISSLKIVLIMTQDPTWAGEKDHIDAQFIKKHFPDFNAITFYIAGPPVFNDAVSKSLKELDIKAKNLIVENFTGY